MIVARRKTMGCGFRAIIKAPEYIPMKKAVENIRITSQHVMMSPETLKSELPISDKARDNVTHWRAQLQNILQKRAHRLFVVVGPCSIHDIKAAHEYAKRLAELAQKVSDSIILVMRVYFEKPRTTVGWKGLVNDPNMNDSFQVESGLRVARGLLLKINEMGMPAATEALDPIVPQYLNDLITWSAIGARTAESQTHREMASGLSSLVGFKNSTDGSFSTTINALQSAIKPHRFLGIDGKGRVTIIGTAGNPWAHVVLRGGSKGPNYDSQHIRECEMALEKIGMPKSIVIDCSHANSNKQHELQPLVMRNVSKQILAGNQSICGLMMESNLKAGNQSIPKDLNKLRYGVSVTDACVDWDTTHKSILALYNDVKDILPGRIDSASKDATTADTDPAQTSADRERVRI
jgi:3-deoxy-7-phosphoheptulonate synthase